MIQLPAKELIIWKEVVSSAVSPKNKFLFLTLTKFKVFEMLFG